MWAAGEGRATQRLVEATLEVLEVKDKPFFCELWLIDPHAALAPSEEQRAPFRGRVPEGFTTPFEVYAGTVTEMDRQLGRLWGDSTLWGWPTTPTWRDLRRQRPRGH